MAAQVFTYLSLLLYFTGVKAWKCAKYEHYFSQQPDYIDCFWDCCGNSFNRHCCAPIGIIVGCCIVGATIVAGIVVVMSCWWSRRKARHTKGPRLFHNRRHSHYPTAPSSVTRPAPYSGPPEQKGPGYGPPQGGYGPPPDRGYGPPAGRYGPPPDRDYAPPSDRNNEKPPIDDFYNERPPAGRGYGPPPDRDPRGAPVHRGPPSNRGPPSRSDFSSADEYSDFEQRGRGPPPRNGNQGRNPPPQGRAPLPSRPVQPEPKGFIDL